MKKTIQTTNTATESTGTEFERFRDFVKQVVSVPKEEIDKREAEYQQQKKAKVARKNKTSEKL